MSRHFDALLDLWRTRRARSAVLASLRPFEASLQRMGQENPRAVASPYLIGFLLACVSGLARDASPSLGTEGTGAVQLEVCAALTGVPHTLLAERLVCLSLGEDAQFVMGCSDAIPFHAILTAARTEPSDPFAPDSAAEQAQALWARVLERCLITTSEG